MTPKLIALLLILSALVRAAVPNPASAESGGTGNNGFHNRGNGGSPGRGHHGTKPPLVVGGFVFGDGGVGDFGQAGNYGNGDQYRQGEWYGLSSGHDDCPLFRKRVMTPDGWRVQMVPVC